MYLYLTIFAILFSFITWRKFNLGLFFLFLLLPTYLIRFNIGPFPTTILEVMIWITILIAISKKETRYKIQTNLKKQILKNQLLFFTITLFLIAATISIFTSTNTLKALGEWKSFYVEPVLIFIILVTTIKNKLTISNQQSAINSIIFALVLSGLTTSILAIVQHFTGWMVPWDFWQNNNTFRVTGWYGYPNGIGLFLAPIFPLAIYLLKQNFNKLKQNNWKLEIGNWALFVSCFLFLTLSPLAIYYAKSTGALIGILAGIFILLLFYKKTRLIVSLVALGSIITLLTIPQLSNIKQELTLQDRSGQIRISMWQETWEFIKDNPITGAGLASYKEKIEPYHTTVNGEGIEIFHHPHNIFLTMWINLGILGLLAFLGIIILFIKNCFQISNFKFQIFLLTSMIIILTTGLVDSPYIKNDLAIIFWLLPALLLINNYEQDLEDTKIKKIS